jgi:superfamily I DNA/RNA helicase
MIAEFNEFLSKHSMPQDPDSACMSSYTSRKGSIKTKILSSSANDASQVIKIIKELVHKMKVEYNDIAIVYPAKGYGKWYRPQLNIEKALQNNDIPYSLIHGERRKKLFECDGVIMSTVDSCLGLDFKYVILCGIHYWDFIRNEKTGQTEKLDKSKLLFDKNVQLLYSEAGKKIYSACSRARDGLFIVDDTDDSSPIKSIIRPKSGRSYYDERY